jgi:NAD+-dependent secondary alcohol dehydrogenase Adh1
MVLHTQGKVKLHTKRYPLDEINTAIDDLHHGKIKGRAVIVPT